VLSNEYEHGAIAMTLTFTIEERGTQVTVTLGYRYPTNSIGETLEAVKFLIAATEAGRVKLVLTDRSGVLSTAWAAQKDLKLEQLRMERLLVRLSYIQMRVRRFGTLSLDKFSEDDLPLIDEVYNACSTGIHETRMSIAMTLGSRPHIPENPKGPMHMVNPGGYWRQLLGVLIPHGQVRIEFLDDAMLRAIADASKSTTNRPRIDVKRARARCHYLDWVPPKEGPADQPREQARRHSSRKRRR
jgi:hypothetical protein